MLSVKGGRDPFRLDDCDVISQRRVQRPGHRRLVETWTRILATCDLTGGVDAPVRAPRKGNAYWLTGDLVQRTFQVFLD